METSGGIGGVINEEHGGTGWIKQERIVGRDGLIGGNRQFGSVLCPST